MVNNKSRLLVTNRDNKFYDFLQKVALPRFTVLFLKLIPSYDIRIFPSSFSLPRRNSDPRSLSRLFYPLPTTVRAFIFIARRFQKFILSSARIEFVFTRNSPNGSHYFTTYSRHTSAWGGGRCLPSGSSAVAAVLCETRLEMLTEREAAEVAMRVQPSAAKHR